MAKETGQRDNRQKNAEPCGRAECGVGRTQEEEAWRRAERYSPHEPCHRLQSPLTQKRNKLIDGNDERDEVDKGEAALEQEAGEPV